MFCIELILFIGAIYLGIYHGGVAIGCAGALGTLCLTLGCGIPAGSIPMDVILVIISVITASAALQAAGGMDYLAQITERILRKNPKAINFLAPLTTYSLTFLTGTGHTSFSVLPVIAQVAREQQIRPSRPLSMAVVASQISIIASPLSAVAVFVVTLLEPQGVSLIQLLAIFIPSTFLGCLPGILVASTLGKKLEKDKIDRQHSPQRNWVKEEVVIEADQAERRYKEIPKQAKKATWLFLSAMIIIIGYAITSSIPGLFPQQAPLSPANAMVLFMMSCAFFIIVQTKTSPAALPQTSIFRSGMSACICVLGVAWMGDTFIQHHLSDVQATVKDILQNQPWALAFSLFFASMLLYSQAAAAKALLPAALLLGATPSTVIIALPAVSALFVLPTYPTLLAAVALDETGSTQIGKNFLNHPFFLPGVVSIISTICLSALLAPLVLSMP